jgi:hypothetical protein
VKSLFYVATSYTFRNFKHIKVPAKCPQEQDKHIPLHCKLSIKSYVGLDYNCFWYCTVNTTGFCILSFGWFPAVWILCANVSEHARSSIFIGGVSRKNKWDKIAFLNIHTYRRTDGSLGNEAYSKPTHTNLYLHRNSYYHPAIKQSYLASLIHTAKAFCDQDSLNQELEFLATVFKDNGYSSRQKRWALKPGAPRLTHLGWIHTLNPDNIWLTQQNAD